MSTKVSELTMEEFRQIIEDVVERKLSEAFADPDHGLELRLEFEQRLRKSISYVAEGGQTLSLGEIIAQVEDE